MSSNIEDHDSGWVSSPAQISLPDLSETPTTLPGCCLALSAPLLSYLASLLPAQPGLTFSIGSGYGLLEALLLCQPYNRPITGVEVVPSSNRFLPPSHHIEVPGSRFLAPEAEEAKVWLFVYPKRVGLVDEYIKEYGKGAVEKIIWAGPKADWEDYQGCFNADLWDVETKSADEAGGRAWEMIAVAVKIRDEG